MTWVQLGGALVTKTGSEDGCGSDWPLCHGALLPQNLPIQTIIELSHRAVSGLSLIIVLWLVIVAWKHISYIKEVKPLCIISVGFTSSSFDWCSSSYVAAKCIRTRIAFRYFTRFVLISICINIDYFRSRSQIRS